MFESINKKIKKFYYKNKKTKVFTYGTLKEGERNHLYLRNAKMLDVDKIYGYKMYDTPYGFPCVIHTGDTEDYIIGEVYEISLETLYNDVDWLEGYMAGRSDNLYNRRRVWTNTGYKVYVYEYGRHVHKNFKHISNGIWTKAVHYDNYYR